MADFTPIADHGLVGDLQTSALITTDGTVDWFCVPRFDSPSIFASLLDRTGAATSASGPRPTATSASSCTCRAPPSSSPGSSPPTASARSLDFMPVIEGAATPTAPAGAHGAGGAGSDALRDGHPAPVQLRPVARTRPRSPSTGSPSTAGTGSSWRCTSCARPDIALSERVRPQHHGEGVRAVVDFTAGQIGGVILESAPDGPPRHLSPDEMVHMFEATRDYWRRWIGRSRYQGRWRESVERSAMTLKLMTYQPTGALVAAPTTGLPEQPGGERNWDYRFTWVRDASFSVYALLGLGYTEEAAAVPPVARPTLRRRRRRRGWRPAAADHVPGGRLLRPHRGVARPLRGLAGLQAGPHRQRRLGPAAARHLRRGVRLDQPR